jgi:hypothetical protein
MPRNIVTPPPPPPLPPLPNAIYEWVCLECNYSNAEDISRAVFCNNLDWEEDVGPFMCIICSMINKPDAKK